MLLKTTLMTFLACRFGTESAPNRVHISLVPVPPQVLFLRFLFSNGQFFCPVFPFFVLFSIPFQYHATERIHDFHNIQTTP